MYDSEIYDALIQSTAWMNQMENAGIFDFSKPNSHLKLKAEAGEYAAHPSLEEAADVMMALQASLREQGWHLGDLADAIVAKVEKNRARTWERQSDGTFQHVEDDEPEIDEFQRRNLSAIAGAGDQLWADGTITHG